MYLINNKKLDNSKIINNFSNLNNCYIKIDYFDKNGNRKIKSNVPLKYMLNRK